MPKFKGKAVVPAPENQDVALAEPPTPAEPPAAVADLPTPADGPGYEVQESQDNVPRGTVDDVPEPDDLVLVESEEVAGPRIIRPHSAAMLRESLGWHSKPFCEGGLITLPEPAADGTKTVRVHEKLFAFFHNFLNAIHDEGLWEYVRSVDGFRVCTREGTRGFPPEYRADIRAYGAGISINAGFNRPGVREKTPFGEPRERIAEGKPGWSFYVGHPVIDLAEKMGVVWCGAETWQDQDRTPIRIPVPHLFQWPLKY